MRRGLMIAWAMTLLCGLTASPVLAQSGCSGKSKTTAKACGKTCCEADFPTMTFMLGEKSYTSHEAAEKAAGDMTSKVVFVVGDQKFDTATEAMKTLACMSECYADRFLSIGGVVDGKLAYCSKSEKCQGAKTATGCAKTQKTAGASCQSGVAKTGKKTCGSGKDAKTCGSKASGKSCCSKDGAKSAKKGSCCEGVCPKDKATKFVVAGVSFDKYDDAVKARDRAQKAADAVKLSYLVNGQKVDCESKVCPKAKAAGQVKFVVTGEETSCEFQARVLMSKARVAAATQAFASKKSATARL